MYKQAWKTLEHRLASHPDHDLPLFTVDTLLSMMANILTYESWKVHWYQVKMKERLDAEAKEMAT